MDLTFSVFFFSVSVFLRLNGCWLLAVSCWLLARNTSTPIAPIALIYSDSFDHSCIRKQKVNFVAWKLSRSSYGATLSR